MKFGTEINNVKDCLEWYEFHNIPNWTIYSNKPEM